MIHANGPLPGGSGPEQGTELSDVKALPDIVGMLVMMGVLGWLRRKHQDTSVDLWLLGLFFVLIEAISVAVFRSSTSTHVWTHMAALDSYLLAGATFGWAARQDLLPGTKHFPFFLLPAIPLFLLTTLFGLDVLKPTLFFGVALSSLVLGAGYILFAVKGSMRRRATLLAVHGAIWMPAAAMAYMGALRWVIYWGLTCLYLLVALSFRCRVRRGHIGGAVIVAGFIIWAGCFLAHPIVRGHARYDDLVEQVWNMQKFFVTLGMVLTLLEDETDRREAEAMHDVLTGLPNRRLFEDRLAQALKRSLRNGKSTALFLVDLNGFKAINDTLGHAAGDEVLRAVAQQLQMKVRTSDTLARCGGDEFCVIVNDLMRRDDCERIAASLRAAVARVALPGMVEDVLTGSVGFALFPEDARDGEHLFALADRRMYHEKRLTPEELLHSLELMPEPAYQTRRAS